MPQGQLESLALGVCLYALKRGLGTQLGNNEIYQAYGYLVNAFSEASRGTFPALQQAPRWFWMICESLRPKIVPFKTGSISYRWLADSDTFPLTPAPIKDFGPLALIWGTLDPVATIDGFPAISPAGGYSEALGTKAVQLVFDCFPGTYINEKVSLTESFLSRDASAFAMGFSDWGTQAGVFLGETGGLSATIQNEVFIQCPILAKFAVYQAGSGGWRAPVETRKSAGTPMYIVPRMIEYEKERDVRNKVSPIFKVFDFDEFYEVLSLTIQGALQLASATLGEDVPVCELTPQRVQILLRQSMMSTFSNHMGMDIVVNGSGSYSWIPFSVGINGVSQTLDANTAMLLPTFLAENIRACSRKVSRIRNSRSKSLLMQDIIPLLGRYSRPQMGNYQWLDARDDTLKPVYATVPVDTSISLIDGGSPVGAPVAYVSFDGAEINALCASWNNFITKLGSFLSPLTSVVAEKGVTCLSTLFLTDHCSYQEFGGVNVANPSGLTTVTLKEPKKAVVSPKGGEVSKEKENKALGNPPVVTANSKGKSIGTSMRGIMVSDPPIPAESNWYTFNKLVYTTSTFPLEDPVWKYQKHWIHGTAIGNLSNEQQVQFQQGLAIEPFKIAVSTYELSDTTMVSLYSKHVNMAKFDYRSRLAPGSEVMNDFKTLAAQGRGGLFTGIAGAIGNMLGIPGAKEFMAGVSDVTGGFL